MSHKAHAEREAILHAYSAQVQHLWKIYLQNLVDYKNDPNIAMQRFQNGLDKAEEARDTALALFDE
jgi:hypothetical protein